LGLNIRDGRVTHNSWSCQETFCDRASTEKCLPRKTTRWVPSSTINRLRVDQMVPWQRHKSDDTGLYSCRAVLLPQLSVIPTVMYRFRDASRVLQDTTSCHFFRFAIAYQRNMNQGLHISKQDIFLYGISAPNGVIPRRDLSQPTTS